MQCHILFALCVVFMLGCIAHGENGIEQDHNEVVARAGNLESRLIVNLFSTLQSDIRELRTEIREQETRHEEKLEDIKIKHETEIKELNAKFENENAEKLELIKTAFEAELSELKSKFVNAEHLEQLKSTYEVEISKLKAQFQDADIPKLKEEIKQIKLKEGLKDKPKTVYAQMLLRGYNTLAAGARVKFTATVANVGDAYKTAHGYFEAPYDGTYLFTVSLCMKTNNWVEFRLVQDDIILTEAHPGDRDWHECGSATAATYMRKGSQVWVELDRVGGGTISDEAGIPSFTGVFVNDFEKL